MGDIKTYLRKMDFPKVVVDTLSHMQKMWLPDGTTQQLSLMKELSQEFVFFEVDQWGNEKEKIGFIKELVVIERFLYFFEQEGPDSKLATFIFLFPHGTALLNKRLPFLSRLVSVAIAGGISNVLTYVGIWMQLNGCASENSLYIADFVCQEHFKTKTELSDIIRELPAVSSLFCASLTISLVTLYLTECPVKRLVDVVYNWLESSPTYCFEPLRMHIPSSFNFSGPQTPISSIMHWVIISPFYVLTPDWNNCADLFYSLHSSLLTMMTKASEIKEVLVWESVPVGRIHLIVDAFLKMQNNKAECISLSLERLAQCLEVGFANSCIHSKNPKLSDLFLSCINLPYHQLVKIVLQKWSREFEQT